MPEESGAHVVVLDGTRLLIAADCPRSAELLRDLGTSPWSSTSASSRSSRAA
jgi:dimethylargininase